MFQVKACELSSNKSQSYLTTCEILPTSFSQSWQIVSLDKFTLTLLLMHECCCEDENMIMINYF